MKKNIFIILAILTFFMGVITVKAVTPSMSSDVSSYPGAGSVPPDSIGSYVNTGYRIYLVDRKTGGLVPGSKSVDMATFRNNLNTISFYKTGTKYRKIAFNNQAKANGGTYTTFLPKSQIVSFPANDTVYLNTYRTIAFPSNYGNSSLGANPVNTFHTTLDGRGKSATDEVSDFYDFLFDYIYPVCPSTDYSCRLSKMKEIGSYTLKDSTKPDTEANRLADYYMVYEPLIFYKIFDGGYYALTATESAMIFNETNFPKWWSGVTVETIERYHEMAPSKFYNVLNYRSCASELSQVLDDFLMGRDGASAALTRWEDRCEKTLEWLLETQVFARNPRFTVHKSSYTIGGVIYSPYIADGTEYDKYPRKYTTRDIVANTRGLAMGIVEIIYEKATCPPTLAGAEALKKGECCTEFKDYLIKLNQPEIIANEAAIRAIYDNSPCNKCSMTTVTTRAKTISSLPANACCADVKKWLDEPLNKRNADYNSYQTSYNNLCVAAPIIPAVEACDYKVNTSYPQSCTTSTSGYISDIDDWSCIFRSPTLGGTNFTDHYDELSNRYCNVFCRQDINYEFPSSSFTILAGTHFTVSNNIYGAVQSWNPVRMIATATCKADDKNINHSLFVTDWNAADVVVNTSWNTLQVELAKKKSVDLATVKEVNSASCSCKFNTTHNSCCKSETRVCDGEEINGRCVTTSAPSTSTVACPRGKLNFDTGDCNACPAGYSPSGSVCESDRETCSSGTLVNGTCESSSSYSYVCNAPDNTKYDLYQPAVSFYNGGNYTQPTFCANARPTFNPDPLRTLYNEAVTTRDNYLVTLNTCSNYTYNHTFNPPLSLVYEEAKYGGSYNLNGTPSDNGETTFVNQANGNVSKRVCTTDGVPCTYSVNSVTYPKNDNFVHTAQRTVSYELAGNIYRYIDKISGASLHTFGASQYSTIGYNNLPVDFTRLPGDYDIEINFSDLGAGNKFNEFIINGKAGTDRCNGSPNCTYGCTYNVCNQILCSSGEPCINGGGVTGPIGLNVIFRPISLDNPFPGNEGVGRNPGSNWALSVPRIIKNRGVTGNEIYSSRTPMYEIILDTRTITEIRKYNHDTSYTDFKLTCAIGTGKECLSNYLTTLKRYNGLKINTCARTASGAWNNDCGAM